MGVDITGLDQHFHSYDVYVYLDADDGKSKSGTSIRSITDGTTTYYLDDADGNTFTGEYVEVTSTTAGTVKSRGTCKPSEATKSYPTTQRDWPSSHRHALIT